MRSGKFIVFEGVEGGGKTSQIQQTYNWLKNCLGADISILITREPGGTMLGLGLRQLLLEKEAISLNQRAELLLYAADRANHVTEGFETSFRSRWHYFMRSLH
jgi:dTMP kinase